MNYFSFAMIILLINTLIYEICDCCLPVQGCLLYYFSYDFFNKINFVNYYIKQEQIYIITIIIQTSYLIINFD